MTDAPAPRPRGSRIPYLLLAAFGSTLVVNGAMTYFAFSSHPGLWTEQAYEKGLAHNAVLRAAAAQAAAGWQVAARLRPSGSGMGEIEITLTQGEAEPLPAEQVEARLVRPTHAGRDQTMRFDPRGDGRWAAAYRADAGPWDLELTVRHQGDRLLATHRVEIP